MTIGERIKKRRKDLDISVDYIAEKLNKNRATIYRYEKGDIDDLPTSLLEPIANILRTTPAHLMGWEDNANPLTRPDILPLKTKKIPLLGEIACGEPIMANREYELYEEVKETLNADFCVKAKGDSMVGARILDGDIVFIKETQEVYNGEIAAVIIDDSVTLKRVYFNKDANQIILNAENNAYPPQVYSGDQLEHVRVLGRAIGFQSVIR